MRATTLNMFELLALLAFVAMAVLAVRVQDDHTLVALDPEALRTGPARERWYGIFFQDQQVGYSMTRSSAVNGGTLTESRSSFRLATLGQLQQVTTAGTALTDDDGLLRRFDFFMAADPVRLTARGEVHEGEIVMEVDQAGETSRLSFPIDHPPQVGMTLENAIRGRQLTVGQTFHIPYFDPLTLAQGDMQIEVTRVELVAGAEEAYWLTSHFSGVETRMLVTPAGETIRQEGALGLSMVRMTAEKAQHITASDPPPDLIALSVVHVNGSIPDPRNSRVVRLRVRGILPGRIVDQAPLQRVHGDEVRVEVPILEELPRLPLSDTSNPQWLRSTLTIQASHPDMRAKALQVVGDAPDRLEATRRLVDFVYRYVEKVPSLGVPNGLEVLRSARGDCNEHTALFVSLARAVDIPSRIAAGVVYSEQIGPRGAFYYHAWPEVRLGGDWDWVPVDPTFGQLPADATHIKLAQGDLDQQIAIMTVLGRLGFDALERR